MVTKIFSPTGAIFISIKINNSKKLGIIQEIQNAKSKTKKKKHILPKILEEFNMVHREQCSSYE